MNFEDDVVHVIGKGRRGRALPFGQQTGVALGRYLRARARDRWAARPELWLGEKNRGPLKANGIKLMLRRRGAAVGIPGLHAHMFRHTAAHRWLADGGSETDLMRIMGWKSPAMLHRYGASAPTSAPATRTAVSGSGTSCEAIGALRQRNAVRLSCICARGEAGLLAVRARPVCQDAIGAWLAFELRP